MKIVDARLLEQFKAELGLVRALEHLAAHGDHAGTPVCLPSLAIHHLCDLFCNDAVANSRRPGCAQLYARLDKIRSYVVVNHLAFTKILKKFDKRCHSQIREEVRRWRL